MDFEATRDFARSLDADDELRRYRDAFNFPVDRDGQRNIYLCGNSLGLQPKIAVEYVEEELENWSKMGVTGHFRAHRPWTRYHRLATDGFTALTGARDNEVIAMNTLTVNLHLLMTTFYRPDAECHKVVIESTAFPSDRFAVTSQIRLHGFDPAESLIEWHPRDDDILYFDDLSHILEDHADEVAMMLLPGVQYYNGQVLDMAELCRLADVTGCAIGLDLAHAVGNVPLELHDWAPDFAAWCTYKFLNGGPGSIAGAFVHSQHLDADGSEQLLGWWGHDEETRFEMAPSFTPAKGAELWQISNPPILSLAPVVASLELFREAGIEKLREKSLQMGRYFDYLLDNDFAGVVESITPPDARGCQLSLVIRDSGLDPKVVFKELENLNVTVDWREPDVIRVAPAPLYNSFEDIYDFTLRLRTAIDK